MKELSIEEKAKRYDEILARAKGANIPYYKEDIMSKVKEFVDYLLPELKESEGERIRKIIKQSLKSYFEGKLSIGTNDVDYAECLAWLEKQGEKNMGISEATKKKLEDNLNKALEKETPESWNKFLDEQDEQKSTKWSEEDEEIHRRCICAMRASACGFPEEEKFVEQVDNWLESFKGRVQLQQKQEWSEEDEEILNTIINHFKIDIECTDEDDIIKWLKSLKERYTWKPSDEQIKALHDLNLTGNISYAGQGQVLIELYNDLKKLK